MNEQNELKESTQAEKWSESLKSRTAHLPRLVNQEDQEALSKILRKLDADYPHHIFHLVDSRTEQRIGTRRVFRDRSYCDFLHENASLGKITHGVMSDGMLGTAQNGRIILH